MVSRSIARVFRGLVVLSGGCRCSGGPAVNLSRVPWSGGPTVNLSRCPWSGSRVKSLEFSVVWWSQWWFEAVFRPPGASWGSFWACWGAFWASEGLLGLILDLLGAPFEAPDASWGSFWGSWGLLWVPPGGILAPMGASWGLPRPPREPERARKARQSVENAKSIVIYVCFAPSLC